MIRKIVSSALALTLVFGTAAVLPEGAVSFGTQIEASAEYAFVDFGYSNNSDGTIVITDYRSDAANVTIPSTIDGKKVVGIRDWAFLENTKIKSVTVPEGVTSIGNSAFRACTNLETVKLPKTLKSIGDTAFFSCTALKSINLPEGISSIGSSTFAHCQSLSGITLPSSVKSIDVWAFAGCNFKSIKIPNGVTSIGESAFTDCEKLESVTIPGSVTQIGPYAFQRTKWLANKRKSNPLVIVNNILIDGSECNGNITVPNGVKEINDCAFMHSSALTGVTLSSSVKTIGACAFSYCDGLTSIEIPGSVTAIKMYAFSECKNLKSVTIPDSVKTLGDDLFKYTPDVTVKCNKGSAAEKYAKDNKINYQLIAAKSISKATVSGLKNRHFTGKAITQTPVVKLGGKTLKAGTDYTVSYKNNKAVGTATVTVTGKGSYTGTVKATFKICPKKTAVKSVTSPKAGQLKLTYKNVSGVTGYQITYSTDKSFKTKTSKSSAKTSKTVTGLKKGKTYYVKVRTYKTVKGTKYYSAYTDVKKVKVK